MNSSDNTICQIDLRSIRILEKDRTMAPAFGDVYAHIRARYGTSEPTVVRCRVRPDESVCKLGERL